MILRKPYAFLIKNFKKINIILLALVIFILWKNLSLYSFVKDYIQTGIYNTKLDSINNYINIFTYLSLIFITAITITLAYLLKYKDKPYMAYVIILIVNILTAVLLMYTKYYFTITVSSDFNLASSLIVRDLVFISTLPYYPLIFLLAIRSIGLDLKKFGFGEDKDFININEEDREEVEVEVSFDKEKFKRTIKNKVRMAKYFFQEHKFSLTIIFILVILLGAFNIYNYTFVKNKIYKPNQTISNNGYNMTINNTYITNRDYTGNIIDNKKSYLVLEATITNTTDTTREFDASNFYLYVDNSYYLPTDRFNTYFTDMGNLYTENKKIKGKQTQKLLFIYEIKNPTEKSNFLLTYQYKEASAKATKIRIKVVDISKFITKATSKLTEEIEVPINLDKKYNFSIPNYQLTDSITYRYEECNATGNCPIYEATLNKKDNKTILYFRFDTTDSKTEFISFLQKYGKVRYKIDGVTKEQKIKYQLSKYRGNYAYIEVSDEIKKATTIELCLTVRSYQYFYKLKGE